MIYDFVCDVWWDIVGHVLSFLHSWKSIACTAVPLYHSTCVPGPVSMIDVTHSDSIIFVPVFKWMLCIVLLHLTYHDYRYHSRIGNITFLVRHTCFWFFYCLPHICLYACLSVQCKWETGNLNFIDSKLISYMTHQYFILSPLCTSSAYELYRLPVFSYYCNTCTCIP